MHEALEQHYTLAEVQERLRLSRSSVMRLLSGEHPRLRSVRIGRSVRVPSSSIAQFLRKHQSTRTD